MVDVPDASSKERPFTIGVSGAHSTGKSTFIARLTHELRRQEVEVATVADLGEKAQQIGLPILDNHTFYSTLWIMTRGISEELAAWPHADVLLVDRAVPDALAYYEAALRYRSETPGADVMNYLRTLARYHTAYYDVMYRTVLDPAIPIAARARRRDERDEFRRLADECVELVFNELAIPHEALRAEEHDAAVLEAVEFVNASMA